MAVSILANLELDARFGILSRHLWLLMLHLFFEFVVMVFAVGSLLSLLRGH